MRRAIRRELAQLCTTPTPLEELKENVADLTRLASKAPGFADLQRKTTELERAFEVLDGAEDTVVTESMRKNPGMAVFSDEAVGGAVGKIRDEFDDELASQIAEREAERTRNAGIHKVGKELFENPTRVTPNKPGFVVDKNHGAFRFYALAATKIANADQNWSREIRGVDRGAMDAAWEMAMQQTDAERTRTFMGQAWALLTDRQQKELADTLASAMLKQLRSNATEASIKNALRELVDARVSEQLAVREDEIATRVRKEVEARWEAEVENVVQQRVRAALDAVRAKL